MSTPQSDSFNQDFNTTEIPRVPNNTPPPPAGSIPPAAFNAAAMIPMQPQGFPPPQQQRSTATIVAIVLAIVLSVLIMGIIAYAFAGDAIKSALGGNTDEQPSQIVQTVTVAPPPGQGTNSGANPSSVPHSQSRPARENFPVPVVAVNGPAMRNDPAGHFQKIYKSGPTSNDFALQVGEDFLSNYYATGSTSTSMSVYSTAMGRSYYMTCIDQGSYVHCTGGTNANVYIS